MIPVNPKNDWAFQLQSDTAHCTADLVEKSCSPRLGSRATYWGGVAKHLESKRGHKTDVNVGKEDN